MKTDAEDLTALSDVQLIEKFQQGNNKAFDALMVKHAALVKKCIRKKVHDNDLQKDVFQNVWLNIFWELKRNHYRENGQMEGWLASIAQNNSRSVMRTEKHYVHGEETKTEEPFIVPAEGMDDTDKKILSIINGMQPVMKRVIILYAIRELKCKEIADKLHIGVNTVTKILSRAYIMIRKKAGIMKMRNNFNLPAVK